MIDARGNGGAIAVNRLVAAGASVSWLRNRLDIDGSLYAPGSLVVAHSKRGAPHRRRHRDASSGCA